MPIILPVAKDRKIGNLSEDCWIYCFHGAPLTAYTKPGS